ncbi:hypothetical protein FOCC_FOCC017172 [Frankliniella occidentalis]|nr:hypothetical protein FOCC_FOCC017172 [Frankliniella occidentalis]
MEAEIASMTWRVCACDIKFPNKSYNKMGGGGMTRRGSQVGSKVAVKAIADKVELNRTLLLELKRVRKLWTAPELLRMGQEAPLDGTQKGDVFSFAIIVHEIVTREGPWSGISDPDMSPYGKSL